ncbi:MAG: hypothetical protein LUD82_00940 [Clostridiales bacterium]|nr:hypothetical protein [Clostridiales bacterium]
MRFDNVSSDIQKFRERDDLTLNELLGMFQNLELDVKKAHQRIETSPVSDADELTSKLIWLCNLPAKIEKKQCPGPFRRIPLPSASGTHPGASAEGECL